MDLVILLLAGRIANSYGMASAAGLTEPGNHKWKVMQVVSPIYSKGIKPEAYVFGNFILSYSPIKFTYQPLVLNRWRLHMEEIITWRNQAATQSELK